MHSVRILAQFKNFSFIVVRINKGMHFPNHFKINNCQCWPLELSGSDNVKGPGVLDVTMTRTGQARRGFLAAEQILIPVLYCPLPNGDNDTLINTGPSIPIIGK